MAENDDVAPAPQTAMLLTDEEWTDLAHICEHYRHDTAFMGHAPSTVRCRELALRVIEAS